MKACRELAIIALKIFFFKIVLNADKESGRLKVLIVFAEFIFMACIAWHCYDIQDCFASILSFIPTGCANYVSTSILCVSDFLQTCFYCADTARCHLEEDSKEPGHVGFSARSLPECMMPGWG
ncbi:hypothetical protein Dsin_022930 [Dipteronia sinensis]|uniref:Uncharacterized protein n=1 Tax=Dipteronia sinensis TaxID=43782 RepID=A0AAE0A2F8_9ROSI|nr:hypothetical protein Dsin_022930 [Dipteronia sinensis]